MKIEIIKPLVTYVILIFSIAFMLRTFIVPGIPDTHDGHSHVARIANYYLALRDHHFPVRWAPNLNYKYGYPVFQYHYQTPYFLASVIYALGFSLEASYKIVYVLAALLSVLAMYWWLKRFLCNASALLGALLYVSAPPFMLQIFVRGSFGEFLGWSLLPVVLLTTDRLAEVVIRKRMYIVWYIFACLAVSALCLSHIMLASFGIMLAGLYGVLRLASHTSSTSWYTRVPIIVSAYVIGVGISAFFLLPALAESTLVNFAAVASEQSFFDHFVYLKQFVYSAWDYGYSVKGDMDTLSFMLGAAQIVSLCIALLLSLNFIFRRKAARVRMKPYSLQLFYFQFTGFGAIFAMSTIGVAVWKVFPYLWQLQFPWRLLAVACIGIAVCGAIGFERLKSRALFMVLLVACFVQLWLFAKPGKLLHKPDYEYFEFPFTSSVNDETMPVDFNLHKNIEYKFQLKDLNNLAKTTIVDWRTQKHWYVVESSTSAMIVERLAYMPGWKSTLDGKLVETNVRHPEYPGLPIIQVPAGRHEIITELTESTPAKLWGNRISLASLGLLVVFILVNLRKTYART